VNPAAVYSERLARRVRRWRASQVRLADGVPLTQEAAAKHFNVRGGGRVWRRWESRPSAMTRSPVPGWLCRVIAEGQVLPGYRVES
jgi:hypothetical protein